MLGITDTKLFTMPREEGEGGHLILTRVREIWWTGLGKRRGEGGRDVRERVREGEM